MKNIKSCIIVDSSSGIKNNQIENVFMIPLTIVESDASGEKSYLDLEEINTKQVVEKIINNKDLKTSQSSLGQMLEILEKVTQTYQRIFVVSLSSGLSGSYNTWNIARDEYATHDINILDAKDLGVGIQTIVNKILEMIKANKSTDEIIEYVEKRKARRYGTLVVTDISQLKKGGRINATKAWIVDKLKLNIIITFDGALDFYDKSKSLDKTIDKCIERLDEKTQFKTKGIKHAFFFTTFLDDESNNEIKKIVDQKLGQETKLEFFPSAIAVHTGAKAFAIYIEANE